VHAVAASPEPLQTRRQAILQAAEDVFAERGYDKARLDDVAQRVGIRRASLLYHFKDKGALYGSVLDSIFEDLLTGYRRVLDGDGPAGARLEETVDLWLDVIARRPNIVRIMLREIAHGWTEHSRPWAERAKPIMQAMVDVIQQGQAEHALRQTNGVHVLMALTGASTFLSLGGTLVASSDSPVIADRATQRELLVAIFRKLLGTRGPRSVVED
jgi:TetR/AcrR family transcriptional regulator